MPEEADITVEKKPRTPKEPKVEAVAPEVTPEPVAPEVAPEATPEVVELVSAEPLAVDPETGETPEELKLEEPAAEAVPVASVRVDDNGVTHYSVPVAAADEPAADEAEVEEEVAPEPVPYRPMVTGAKWRGFTAERRARRKGIVL